MIRDKNIDASKGIGIIFVVLFHAEIAPCLFGTFHMPLFAFLSGMVYKNISTIVELKSYINKKMKGIYFPFLKYNLIYLNP